MQKSKQTLQDARPERQVGPREAMEDALRRIFGCSLQDATEKQIYRAL